MASSHVYLMAKDALYKIGRSKGPAKRSQAPSKKGRLGEVVHSFPCVQSRLVEQHLHNVFADKRRYGEWFALDDADVALICLVTRCDLIADLPPGLREARPQPPHRHWGTSDGYGQLNIRLTAEDRKLLEELVRDMHAALGINVSMSDVVTAGLAELRKKYPPAPVPVPAPKSRTPRSKKK